MGGDREEEEETCDIGLSLRLGSGGFTSRSTNEVKHKTSGVQLSLLFPSNPKEEIVNDYHGKNDGDRWSSKTVNQNDQEEHAKIVKRDNTSVDSNIDKYDHTNTRKKLRLTKEQANLLETSFKQHNTLNMMQKQELAERLDLRPRQVEVWFQNRRARTKLKKTEVDCEVLKKCVERLNEENRRLKKELHELRSVKLEPPSSSSFYPHHMPKNVAASAMCRNCNKVSNKSSSENKHNTLTLFSDIGNANDKI
ncbi:hypothetical protein C5167_015542 [Papaver somniferum]|uniref:Homeobox domain-containing protein n=1 Tax=Papaver somniferum TaxID=3469 RepID=A0A4Y7JAL3_PAPSO|nr:homeobox-leucine zipper protein HOX15-like [Papaver somniferum]RZC56655.1 hypothetical protein C5167_015542 [Papaver somniferum]